MSNVASPQVVFSYSAVLWPWSGWIAVHVTVSDEACEFTGRVAGELRVAVQADPEV